MTASSETYDVAIIGGGPSGSTAASLLAKAGCRVCVVDKERFPRPTVGESLIPHFWRYADLLGAVEDIDAADFVVKAGAVHTWNGTSRTMGFGPFGYERAALHVERDVFDDLLLRRAAAYEADLVQGARVRSVDLHPDRCVIHFDKNGDSGQVRSRYLIDASGQAAVISRQENLRYFEEDFRFAAMWGYFTGGSFTTRDGEKYPAEQWREYPPVTYVTGIGDPGRSWLWHILLREQVSVGLILDLDYLKQLKGKGIKPQEEFLRLAYETPIFGDLMDGAVFVEDSFRAIKDYAYSACTFRVANCLLVGDGAAFMDPINSVGVPFSMYTGWLAARSIGEALHNGSTSPLDRYDRDLRTRITIYKALAMRPEQRDLRPEEVEMFRRAIGFESALEKELILLQSKLTGRPHRIERHYRQWGLPTETDKLSGWHRQW